MDKFSATGLLYNGGYGAKSKETTQREVSSIEIVVEVEIFSDTSCRNNLKPHPLLLRFSSDRRDGYIVKCNPPKGALQTALSVRRSPRSSRGARRLAQS